MTLKVNEIFYSLQGEGARAGKPSIFIRLSDCNLRCTFCDTEFVSGREMTTREILQYIKAFPCNEIVWTGGEPTLQLTNEVLDEFPGYYHCIETNGTNPIPEKIHYIALSPKVAEHVIRKNVPSCDEVRYVRGPGMAIPEPATEAKRKYISPMADGDKISMEALRHCIRLCLENPEWSLSVQQHKLWGIR
jgi:organic radical activating enzyme